MYICKQVNPEWQDDGLFYTYKDKNGRYKLGWNDEVYENNVIIYGNNEYHYSLTTEFFNLTKLENVYYEYGNGCYWATISEFINWYFPKANRNKYTTKEIHKWKMLLAKYEERYELEDIVCEALELMTDKKWRQFKMVGTMQREWQYGYASEEITDKDLDYIEMCYFNTGVEYQFYESEEDYENDCPSTCYYVDSYHSKQRLCEHIGCKENELKVYNFTGYKQIPQYEEE